MFEKPERSPLQTWSKERPEFRLINTLKVGPGVKMLLSLIAEKKARSYSQSGSVRTQEQKEWDSFKPGVDPYRWLALDNAMRFETVHTI